MTMNPINLQKLRISVAGSDKIPADYECTDVVTACYDRRNEFLGNWCVTVIKSPDMSKAQDHSSRYAPKSSSHRVFVRCKQCDRLIPAGRIAQHLKAKDHQSE